MYADAALSRDRLRALLDRAYDVYTHRDYLGSDPVGIVHRFREPDDIEIAGLLAAGLAYGRVAGIRRSLDRLFERLGPEPARFLDGAPPAAVRRTLRGFQHRWTTAAEIARLLEGVRRMRAECGTLGEGFRAAMCEGDGSILLPLQRWVDRLHGNGPVPNSLLANPSGGSACKRLLLYLRWMVRKDAIDLGVWQGVPPARLVVPVDVHMHRVGMALGFTRRKQANGTTAREITEGFRRVAPEDPVRYDFALTRPGILAGIDPWRVRGGDQ